MWTQSRTPLPYSVESPLMLNIQANEWVLFLHAPLSHKDMLDYLRGPENISNQWGGH